MMYTNKAGSISSPIIPLDRFLRDVFPHVSKNRMDGLSRTSSATAFQKFKRKGRPLGQRVAGMSRSVTWSGVFDAT